MDCRRHSDRPLPSADWDSERGARPRRPRTVPAPGGLPGIDRPTRDRPADPGQTAARDRPADPGQTGRPGTDRPTRDRPPPGTDRPGTNRPPRDRPAGSGQTGRPGTDRPSRDRPAGCGAAAVWRPSCADQCQSEGRGRLPLVRHCCALVDIA